MEPEQIIVVAESSRDWVDYLAALLTPAIAIIGSFIAIKQWGTDAKRLKHELFDRRYEQFMAVRDFLGSIQMAGRVKDEAVQPFLIGITGIRFTYDQEIYDFVHDHIWSLASELRALREEIEGVGVGEERTRNVRRQAEIKAVLYADFKSLETKFSKYLQLGH